MKKTKITGALAWTLALLLALTACGGQGAPEGMGNGINMDDIPWTLDEAIVDGERQVVFGYTNQTEFPIVSLEIKFAEKSGVTKEQKDEYLKSMSDALSIFAPDEEELAMLAEQPLSMWASCDKMTANGETTTGGAYYYEGFFPVQKAEHCELVEPDIATIVYIDGEELITEYYDFRAGKYSYEEPQTAFEWADNDMGNKVPKPEALRVEVNWCYEDNFHCTAYGMKEADFKAYVDQCKAMGYTNNASSWEGYYTAEDAAGCSASVDWDEEDFSMSISVRLPD